MDLAYAAVTFAPLHHPGIARPAGAPDMERASRRLRLFVDAYGLDDRTGFIDRVLARVEARAADFVRLSEEGDPAMKRLLANGHLSDQRRTADHIRRNRSALEAALIVVIQAGALSRWVLPPVGTRSGCRRGR